MQFNSAGCHIVREIIFTTPFAYPARRSFSFGGAAGLISPRQTRPRKKIVIAEGRHEEKREMKNGIEKLLAILLSAALMLMPMTVFAEGEGDGETPPQDEPAAAVYQLTGTVYQYVYSASESSGSAKSGIDISIELKSGSVTVTSGSDGKFSYTLTDDERTENGKYEWSIDRSDTYYEASGIMEEGTEEEPKDNKLYIRERYKPQGSDYQFKETDSVKKINGKVWVKEAGTYEIEGVSGKRLSKNLDGTAADSIDVDVASDGSVSSFFVFIGSFCSSILTGERVKVDSGAPEVVSVTTEAGDDETYVKEHGVYGREKAELIVNVDVKEDAGIKEVYLVSDKNGETVRYDAASVIGEDNQYSVTIGLPDKETLMDAQLVKLIAVDVFGNKSSEVLIAKTEEGSSVTLEQIAPTITKSESGKKSKYGWYSELPTLTAKASDALSGLEALKIEGEGSTIAEVSFAEKIKEEKSISGKASFSDESESGIYKYTVTAKDNAGNTATDTFNIKIDQKAPKISAEGAKNGEHYSSNPTITVNETEKHYKEEGNRIFVNVVRDGKKTTFDNIFTQQNTVNIPESAFSEDGEYKVTIFAKDAAENDSETLVYTFIKDSKAPKVSISGVKNGAFYNKAQKVSVKVVEKHYKSNNVTVSAVKKLGNSKKNMGFPWKNKDVESVNSKTFSQTGTYTITASAIDKAGNKGGPKKVTFTIDTKSPVITITGVRDGGIYTYGQGLAPGATVTDDYLASKSISFTRAGETVSNPSFEQIKENDGLYTMTVTASDKAGNTASKTISFTVNRFGSWFEYDDNIKNLQGKAVQNVDSDLIITERNVSKVTDTNRVIYRDGQTVGNNSETTKNEEGLAEKVYRHKFPAGDFETEGAYEINVISKDEVGNEMESKEENGKVLFWVDRTEPSITVEGIDPKGIKASSAILSVKASDLLTGIDSIAATVDGNAASLTETDQDGVWTLNLSEGLRQSVKIMAKDKAGNEAVFEDKVSVSENAFKLWFDRLGKFVLGGAAALLAGGAFLILAKKRDDDDDNETSDEG